MRKKSRINAVIIVLAVITGIGLSLKPWRVYIKQRADTARQVREMRLSESKQEALLQQRAQRRSSIGQEEQARESGYLGPGEAPIKP